MNDFFFLSRQTDRQLAVGPVSSANHLRILVLPDHRMGGAKADGQEAARQPQTCPDCLQLCHGLPVCLHVLRGNRCTVAGKLRAYGFICRASLTVAFRETPQRWYVIKGKQQTD